MIRLIMMAFFLQKHIHYWLVSLPGWLTKIAVPNSSAKRAFPKPLGSFLISSTPNDGSLGAIILFSLKYNRGDAVFDKLNFKHLMLVLNLKSEPQNTELQFAISGYPLLLSSPVVVFVFVFVFFFVILLRSQPSQTAPQPRWPSQTACLALGSPRHMDGAINQWEGVTRSKPKLVRHYWNPWNVTPNKWIWWTKYKFREKEKKRTILFVFGKLSTWEQIFQELDAPSIWP